jgi:hypothetical protein
MKAIAIIFALLLVSCEDSLPVMIIDIASGFLQGFTDADGEGDLAPCIESSGSVLILGWQSIEYFMDQFYFIYGIGKAGEAVFGLFDVYMYCSEAIPHDLPILIEEFKDLTAADFWENVKDNWVELIVMGIVGYQSIAQHQYGQAAFYIGLAVHDIILG